MCLKSDAWEAKQGFEFEWKMVGTPEPGNVDIAIENITATGATTVTTLDTTSEQVTTGRFLKNVI